MRIHLSLDPAHLVQPVAGPSSGPLVNIGGDLVLIELQGELHHEGDKPGGVVGILGLDRPDKPTLHLGQHHLLHGKMATLAKPYAVIRRALATVEGVTGEVEGDAEEEDDLEDEQPSTATAKGKKPTPAKSSESNNRGKGKGDEGSDEEEEGPLFPAEAEYDPFQTPAKVRKGSSGNGKGHENGHASSSPSTIYPSSAMKDFSSELGFSSPPVPMSDTSPKRRMEDDEDEDEDEEEWEREEEARRRKRAKKATTKAKERTRRYEVVGIVRKKVVFALRPEPIVTATILPE